MAEKNKHERRPTPTARQLYLSPPLPDEAAQEILERDFFSSIRLRNGTYKYTYSHRLDDVNESVMGLLPQARPLRLMDVAVSSGISTLEWVAALEHAGIKHEMVAGDLSVNAYLLSVGKHLHALTDATGYPLQFDLFGKAIPNPPWRRHRALYFFPLRLLNKALAAKFGEAVDDHSKAMKEQSAAPNSVNCQRIALVSPRLQQQAGLQVVEDDILSDTPPTADGFHVLRAANILNRSYFDDETLVHIANNLRRRLTPGGLFIVCRTDDTGVNHGTVFALTSSGEFEDVARIGNGSEVERLILELPPPEEAQMRERVESVMASG
ncbi:MAG: hypothetical protein QOC96_2515 [Acidobacteriota bacterium]|jgi:hypothetical protein|nr:hypothetical protein [Acidobacteriota bacterium]